MSYRAHLALFACAATFLISGCSPDSEVDGCSPPPAEEQLMNSYRDEPIFRAVPPGAIADGGIRASKACRRIGDNGVSRTVVSQRYELPKGYRTADLTQFFLSASIASGWWRLGDRDAPRYPKYPDMSFCKTIDSITSYLSVVVRPIPVPATPDRTPSANPDELIVAIEAAPDQSSCHGS
jgi:hypothetical protein